MDGCADEWMDRRMGGQGGQWIQHAQLLVLYFYLILDMNPNP